MRSMKGLFHLRLPRVGHDRSNLAAAAAAIVFINQTLGFHTHVSGEKTMAMPERI